MARDQKIKVRIEADGSQAKSEVKQVESSFTRLQKTGQALRAHWLALTAATTGLVLAFKSIISASAEQELAVRKLDAALLPLGESASAVSKALQEQAAALQQVTAYGDEAIIRGQALIASFTRDEEVIKNATKAAVDLSAAIGVDLNSAFLLLGRAATGETSMLSRYGIMLDESIPKSEKFAAAIEKINQQFGGQAVEQAKTFSGQMSQLGNAFGDLQEALGDSVTQSKNATNALASLKSLIEGLIPLARRMGEVFTAIGEAVWNLALPLRALHSATASLTDLWLRFAGGTEIVEVRTEALEETAKRYGLTTGELTKIIEENLVVHRELDEQLGKSKRRADELAESQRKLGETQEAAAEKSKAFAASLSALGVKLSTELNTELEKLDALLLSAEERYRNGEISARDYSLAVAAIATKQAELKGQLSGATTSIEANTKAAKDNAEAMHAVGIEIAGAGRAAVTTAAQFDALAASAGRATAVSAALAGGATLGLGGTRVYLPGGGSRLTSSPGLTGVFFNPEKRSYVSPGGGVVFV